MGRSSELAGASPKAVTTPSGLTERATLNPYTHSVFETDLPKAACPANRPLRRARAHTTAGTSVVSSMRYTSAPSAMVAAKSRCRARISGSNARMRRLSWP